MPVRSSICTYSPSASSKYSPATPSSLSIGHYKPLISSSAAASRDHHHHHHHISNGYSSPSSASKSSSLAAYRTPSSGYGASRYSFSSGSSSSYTSPTSNCSYSTLPSSPKATLLGRTEHLLGSSLSSASASSATAYSPSSPSSSSLGTSSYSSYRYHSPLSSARRISYTTSSDGASSAAELPREVPRGLVNLGNTCYMNSVIQSLYSVESFRNLILTFAGSSSHIDKPLIAELCSLFKSMRDSSSSISPSSFKYALSRHLSKFSGLGQQDAQEFLRYLINSVHEECNRAASRPRRLTPPKAPKSADEAWQQYREIVDDSPFVDLLVGQMCSTIICGSCQNKSLCWDPFWDLSLPLQRRGQRHFMACKLSDVIDDFIAKETLDGDERPICSRCKQPTRSTKQIKLSRLPKLLILHLKKFTNDGYKLTSAEVAIDRTLTFNNDTNYTLAACVSHHGHSSTSGHYTSHCRYSTNWYHYNDERVKDVTSSFDSVKLDDAYVLFYTQQHRRSSTATTPTMSHRSKL